MDKDGSKEVLLMAENNTQAPKGSGDKVAVAEPAQANQAKAPKKDDKGTDSLLDVFTSEELVESSISRLSKDLSDISIDSLLEQTKKVAEEIKWGH
jgi:hypothetical protein